MEEPPCRHNLGNRNTPPLFRIKGQCSHYLSGCGRRENKAFNREPVALQEERRKAAVSTGHFVSMVSAFQVSQEARPAAPILPAPAHPPE